MKALQKTWPTLTPAERETALEAALNRQAVKSGMPPLEAVPEELPKGNGGNFDFKSWRVKLNKSLLASSALSNAEAMELSNTVYHETRHAEQWFLIAQKRAADGATAEEIRKATSIPLNVTEKAVSLPLAKGSCEEACATQLNESVYGKDAAHRRTALRDIMAKLGDRNTAIADKAKIDADPKSTPKQKTDATTRQGAADTAFQAAHKVYKNLPEEADAFETGDMVDSLWGKV